MGQISLSVGAPLENLAGGVIYQGPEKALEMGTFLHRGPVKNHGTGGSVYRER